MGPARPSRIISLDEGQQVSDLRCFCHISSLFAILRYSTGSGLYDMGIAGSPYPTYHREDIKGKKEDGGLSQAKVGCDVDEELLRYTREPS